MLTWVSDNPGIATAVISLVASVLGAIVGSIVAPWINEGVKLRKEAREEQRRLADERRKLIASWRSMISDAKIFAEVTKARDVYDRLVGRAEFQSLEAHAGQKFRAGVSIEPALRIGSDLPPPLEDIARTIDELEARWALRP